MKKAKRVKPDMKSVAKRSKKGDLPSEMRKLLAMMQDRMKMERTKTLHDRPRVTFEIPAWVELPWTNKKKASPISDEKANRILLAKRTGASDGMAAAYAGVPASTLSHWLHDESETEPFVTFQRLFEEAKAEPKFFFLDAIVVNAYYNPELALKMLQRLEPEQFAEVMVVKGEHTIGPDDTLAAILQRALDARMPAKSIGSGEVKNGLVIPHDPRGTKGGK